MAFCRVIDGEKDSMSGHMQSKGEVNSTLPFYTKTQPKLGLCKPSVLAKLVADGLRLGQVLDVDVVGPIARTARRCGVLVIGVIRPDERADRDG